MQTEAQSAGTTPPRDTADTFAAKEYFDALNWTRTFLKRYYEQRGHPINETSRDMSARIFRDRLNEVADSQRMDALPQSPGSEQDLAVGAMVAGAQKKITQVLVTSYAFAKSLAAGIDKTMPEGSPAPDGQAPSDMSLNRANFRLLADQLKSALTYAGKTFGLYTEDYASRNPEATPPKAAINTKGNGVEATYNTFMSSFRTKFKDNKVDSTSFMVDAVSTYLNSAGDATNNNTRHPRINDASESLVGSVR